MAQEVWTEKKVAPSKFLHGCPVKKVHPCLTLSFIKSTHSYISCGLRVSKWHTPWEGHLFGFWKDWNVLLLQFVWRQRQECLNRTLWNKVERLTKLHKLSIGGVYCLSRKKEMLVNNCQNLVDKTRRFSPKYYNWPHFVFSKKNFCRVSGLHNCDEVLQEQCYSLQTLVIVSKHFQRRLRRNPQGCS